MPPIRQALLALPLLLAGCAPAEIAHPPRVSRIEVAGRVTTASGAPVAGAGVTITVSEVYETDRCLSPETVTVPSRADGTFSREFRSGPVFRTACVSVLVEPPADSGLLPRTVEGPRVQFSNGAVPPLSFVAVVLPP